MYAIIEVGGHQWKVEPGTRFDINRVPSAVGSTHTVERVLLAHDGATVQVGTPYLPDAKVVCEVLAHRLGPKTISYYFTRRENWRKTIGHRQPQTQLLVKDIVVAGVATGIRAAEPALHHHGAGPAARPAKAPAKHVAPKAGKVASSPRKATKPSGSKTAR